MKPPSLTVSLVACLALPAVGFACGCSRSGDVAVAPSAPASSSRPASSRRAAELQFTDIALQCGLSRVLRSGSAEKLWILENIGTGCALFDADGDGLLDIYLANAGTIEDRRLVPGPGAAYYRQLASERFEDRTESAGLTFRGWSTGVAVGDIDNDGDEDLFVGGYGPDHFYRNHGNGVFEEEARKAGLMVGDEKLNLTSSATFFDVDGDGFLDLYITKYLEFDLTDPPNQGRPCLSHGVEIACGPGFYRPQADHLYRNVKGERFVDVSHQAGVDRLEGAYGLGVAAGDLDGDGRPDLYVANDTTANFLWRNVDGARFEEIALLAGAALSEEGQGQAGMGVDFGDADGDTDLDIAVTNYSEEHNAFYRNLGDGTFEEAGHTTGLTANSYLLLGWGVKFTDLDNDGDLDLVTANGHVYPRAAETNPALAYAERCLFYINGGNGRFEEVGERLGGDGSASRPHRGLAAGDVDNDGDVDLLLTVLDGPPVLLRNDTPLVGGGNWISLLLKGVRSNRDGIGARVLLSAGGKVELREVSRGGSYLSASDARLHFGLGEAPRADRVTIRWPSGQVDELGPLEAGAFYTVIEGSREAVPR